MFAGSSQSGSWTCSCTQKTETCRSIKCGFLASCWEQITYLLKIKRTLGHNIFPHLTWLNSPPVCPNGKCVSCSVQNLVSCLAGIIVNGDNCVWEEIPETFCLEHRSALLIWKSKRLYVNISWIFFLNAYNDVYVPVVEFISVKGEDSLCGVL